MTEDEWSAEKGDDLRNWKCPVVPRFSDRQFRLFWDQALPLLSHRLFSLDSSGFSARTSSNSIFDIFQSFERGKIPRKDCWNALLDIIFGANHRYLSRLRIDGNPIEFLEAHQLFVEREFTLAWAVLRDILGNPFQETQVDPAWFTANEGRARLCLDRIDRENTFELMPLLGKLLAIAGCTDADILEHCGQAHGHVVGCWVIDRLLGRE